MYTKSTAPFFYGVVIKAGMGNEETGNEETGNEETGKRGNDNCLQLFSTLYYRGIWTALVSLERAYSIEHY